MNNKYLEFLKNQNPVRIRGNFTDVVLDGGSVSIKNIYWFKSARSNLPYFLFQSKNYSFLGISLARQSSDFLVRLFQKKVYRASSGFKVIQYRLPKDLNSLKLIVFREWEEVSDYSSISSELQELQTKFVQNIDDILSA